MRPYRNAKDVGVLYFSLIPLPGSRIALYKDKQLELAHAVIYYSTLLTVVNRI
ncbi:MAG: hypothetical protein K2K03_08835 [Prevotella sp.]|nr:hypothetical protein [Prevotella sp.]